MTTLFVWTLQFIVSPSSFLFPFAFSFIFLLVSLVSVCLSIYLSITLSWQLRTNLYLMNFRKFWITSVSQSITLFFLEGSSVFFVASFGLQYKNDNNDKGQGEVHESFVLILISFSSKSQSFYQLIFHL